MQNALLHPCFIGRIAGIELEVAEKIATGGHVSPQKIQELEQNAGIHAPTDASRAAYVTALLAAYDRCTHIAEWERDSPVYAATGKGQELVLKRTPHIPTFSALDLEPYYAPERPTAGWMPALKDKRILIIHPFTASLERQSHHLAKIFPGREWFEGCTFQFVAPPMSMAGNHGGRDWRAHLDEFLERLPSPSSYDLALVAAGGYGMLIADHVFQQGKSVIYVGGALQLFFGVIGKRWMTQPKILRLVTDAWIRPTKEEQPVNHKVVENGCYW